MVLVRWTRRLWSWMTWQRVPASAMGIRRPGFEAILCSLYAVLLIGAAWLTGVLILAWPVPVLGAASFLQDLWYVGVFKVVLMLLVPWAAFRALGYRARHLLPGWRFTAGRLAAVILSFAAGFCLNLGHVSGILDAASRLGRGELALRLSAAFILPLIQAALPEEFVYRGLLQTRLEAVFGRAWAVGITALLFTAWHLPTRFLLAHGVEGEAGQWGSVLVGTGLPVLAVALVLGLFWDRYRSLPPLVAAHWGIDLLPIVSSLFGIDR